MNDGRLRMAASCARGMEELTAREVAELGGEDLEILRGLVSWEGSLAVGYKFCLWSRYASRVFLQLKSFAIANISELYSHSLDVCWQDHMGIDTTFAVDCTLSGDPIVTHSKFAALRVKDAIADYFRELWGARPSVDAASPSLRIHLHIQDNQVTLSLDLSGESLHRRGYRVSGGTAPLKENLAATLVALSGWLDEDSGGPLLDPMCGTGTLLIEAALMYGDSAPGLSRRKFGFMGWRQHDAQLWKALVDEAVAREDAGLEKEWPPFIGYDADPVMVAAATNNVEKAGLAEKIVIKRGDLAGLQRPAHKGMLLTNLPFGERLSEKEEVAYLYSAYGRIARERFSGWRLAVFLSNPEQAEKFGISWQKKYRLFNGDLPCRLLVGLVPANEESPFRWIIRNGETGGDGFANRLRKNLKKMQKWAQKEGIHCYRVYDRDLPEYNFSIDLYEKWVHLQEYAPPATVDPALAETRLDDALKEIREILGIRRERIFVKTRRRQRGNEQYQKREGKSRMIEVREGQCRFLVNLTGYLDTGLFLDHRPLRMRLAREVYGKRFLNLFGYSGTATVHAAMGGATATTTVDLSANYLQWTKMNMALNGFSSFRHRTVKADCLQWLAEDHGTYDLIFVDPPTFSNTKKEKRVFDVQRDHSRLLMLSLARLSSTGLLIFSTNFKRFKLDSSLAELCVVRDISEETIPFDFSRNKKVHFCWEMAKRNSD